MSCERFFRKPLSLCIDKYIDQWSSLKTTFFYETTLIIKVSTLTATNTENYQRQISIFIRNSLFRAPTHLFY